jgi:hypothetical protein
MTLDELKTKQKELSERRQRLLADKAANEQRRKAIAFEAESGVVAARKEIAELTKAAAQLDSDLLIVDAATEECGRRIVAWEAEAAQLTLRQNAQAALSVLAEFERRGAALNDKLAEFVAEYQSLCQDFRQLERIGFGPTTFALVANNMRRAVASALHDTDLRQDYLAPRERTTFQAVISAWASNVRLRANAVINRKAAQKAA